MDTCIDILRDEWYGENAAKIAEHVKAIELLYKERIECENTELGGEGEVQPAIDILKRVFIPEKSKNEIALPNYF